MPTSREQRESEKILQRVWTIFPQVIVCVWYPIKEDAIYYIDMMIETLQKLKEQMKKEEEKKRIKKGGY